MARPWTPQEDLPGVRAVMDIRGGRTPASGATQAWASQFGSKTASQATAANQPAYSDTALGSGRPGLSFDGTDFLGGLAVDATSSSRTVVALASFTNAATNRTIVGGTADGHYAFRRNASRQMQVVASNAAAVATDTTVVADATPVILSSRYTQATVADFRQNGRQTANVVPSGNAIAPSAVMQIGAALSGQQMVGAIGSIVIADAYVSDEDVARIEGWLAHANGAAALLVDGHPYKSAPPTVATSQPAVTATGSATFAPMAGASTARARARGQGNGNLATMSGASTGRVSVRGAVARTLGALLGASAATAPARGSGFGQLGPLSGSAEGRVVVRAGVASALASMTGAGRGSGPVNGSGSFALAPITGTATARSRVRAHVTAVLGSLIGAARAGRPSRTPNERTVVPAHEPRAVTLLREPRVVEATRTGAIVLKWPTKDPNDVLDYAIDWTARLDGDQIASVTWIVPADLAADREGLFEGLATVWLSGGRVGTWPVVTCRITTSAGRRMDQSVQLPIHQR